MAEAINDGNAHLTALTNASDVGLATTLASSSAHEYAEQQSAATESAPVDIVQFKGTEKRRSPRYNCEGSVRLAEEGCDVYTWAKFTDVSLHGCYVDAQATYPVGTSLNMKMELNDARLETKGIVRVNYPYLGMGIAFVDLSEENRYSLKNLLSTVTFSRAVAPAAASVVSVANPADTIRYSGAFAQALMKYFNHNYILTREDFIKILAKNQDVETV